MKLVFVEACGCIVGAYVEGEALIQTQRVFPYKRAVAIELTIICIWSFILETSFSMCIWEDSSRIRVRNKEFQVKILPSLKSERDYC